MKCVIFTILIMIATALAAPQGGKEATCSPMGGHVSILTALIFLCNILYILYKRSYYQIKKKKEREREGERNRTINIKIL